MSPHRLRACLFTLPKASLAILVCALLLFYSMIGCASKGHTSDSRLQKIDQMLSAQLQAGTPRGRVEFFLNSRGYPIQDSPNKSDLVAVVSRIDTKTLEPETARVTFHFDPNDKLVSFDLRRAPNPPLPH
ncbi:MAG TPA: hypothetical protein VJN93_04425 [Candidatus Acidoferrum sp.]|nr:hypothetical protein [Candidatus Acidoferrum sp.]